MSQKFSWSAAVDKYVGQGLFADAEIFLEKSYRSEPSCSDAEKIEKLSKLIQICYTRLRHDQAGLYSSELENFIGINAGHWKRSLFISYLVCLDFLLFSKFKSFNIISLHKKLSGALKKPITWEHANILLFGNYWQNIRKSLSLSLYQYKLGASQQEQLLSIGFTAYSLSYLGHNLLGNLTLKKVVKKAKSLEEKEVVARLNPHLAIAYGMSAQTKKALAIYEEMETSENLPSFYRLVIAANKIGLSLADIGPAAAQAAINLCFDESFSLSNSANHVQIYGGQAILYALANRPDEAKSLMKKSLLSSESCGGPLNFLFYYRMEAMMWLILKNHENCRASIHNARIHLDKYGGTKWHAQEIDRISCANSSIQHESFILSKIYQVKFLAHSLLTFNAGLIVKGIKIYTRFMFNSNLNYWHEKEVVSFFRHYFKGADDTKTSHLGKISLRIASSFIDSYQSISLFDQKGLEVQIKNSLPVTDVVFGNDKTEIIRNIQAKYSVSDFIVVSENSDRIRIKCADFGYFICVPSPNVAFGNIDSILFVGILVQQVDIQSEELIEAFLRVILTQYIFNSALINEEKKRFDIEKRAATNQTIASTVQMLAHDVRRPFSMVQGILDVLASTEDAKDAQTFAVKHLPEIKRAIASVTNMLSDVIEVGTQGKLELQSMSLTALIDSVLAEHFRYNETADVNLIYNFQHQNNVHVDVSKISRVLTNIVVNALQAMSFSGDLSFTTYQDASQASPMLHFITGNTGSFIPEDEIAKLFEPYYTKGKKSGTGLGLAIADKIIREHGGDIWCISDEEKGTEFHFTLPLDKSLDNFDSLPFKHSKDIYLHYQPKKEKDIEQRPPTDLDEENKFESLTILLLKEFKRNISILITDDEPFYRSILKEQILFSPKISEAVDITLSSSGEQTLKLCKDNLYDIIVMDVDFGPALANGFETVRKLRDAGNNSKIIIHSNRGALQYQSMSIEAGADLFIPKPMSRAVFLKIVSSVVQELQSSGNTPLSA